MTSPWRLLAATVLLAAALVMLVHSHQTWEGQRCELCRVQQLPTLYTPLQDPLAALPAGEAWHVSIVDIFSQIDSFVATTFGRAPPAFFS